MKLRIYMISAVFTNSCQHALSFNCVVFILIWANYPKMLLYGAEKREGRERASKNESRKDMR